jgi:hypothetical protein
VRPLWVALIILAILAVPVVTLVVAMRLMPAWRPSWAFEPGGHPSGLASADHDTEPSGAGVGGKIVDAEGEPVAGASVRVVRGGDAASARATASDAAGAFHFTDLPAGAARVVAEQGDKGAVASAELALVSGQSVDDLVLTLQPGHVVRGRVSDEEGQPLDDATVAIEGAPWLTRVTRTSEGGGYLVAHVADGAALVRFTAPGHAEAVVKLRRPSMDRDEIVNVRLRKEPDVEGVVLDPDGSPVRASVYACGGKDAAHKTVSAPDGKFSFPREMAACPLVAFHDAFSPSDEQTAQGRGPVTLKLQKGGGIAGVVVDEGGGAVPAFFVGVESFTPSVGEREFSVRSGRAKSFSDPTGAFALDRLAPGSYVLSVGVEGRAPVRSSSIDVRAGQVTSDVRVVVRRGGTVEGQIFDDEGRAPLAGAHVSFDATTSVRGEGLKPVQTDASGHYRLENAPSGPLSLRVERDGYRTRIVAGLRVEPAQVLSQDIGLASLGDGGAQLVFGGVGAVLGQTREGIAFSAVFDGAPAQKAGAQQGDLLRRIDGESVEGMSVADAIQRLRGEQGSLVRVTVQRPGNGLTLDLAITRAEITR